MYTNQSMDLWIKSLKEASPQDVSFVVENLEREVDALSLVNGYDQSQILQLKKLAIERGATQSCFHDLLEHTKDDNVALLGA